MNKLPSDWQIKTINEVCNIYTGNSINKKKKEENFIGLKEGLNYIGTKDISFNNIIEYENGVKIPFKDLKDFKIAKSNTSLLCIEGGSAGRKIGFTNQDVCFVNKLCCFEAIEDEPKFIYFYLQSNDFLREFNSNIQGLIGGVNKENLRKIKIPIPPLNEQKRIASALSKIDAYLENTIKLIEEKERFKRGIAKKLLTCKEGENIPEARFKGFEDEWETKTLNSISNIKKGKQKNKLDLIADGKYPVLNGGMNFSGYCNSYNREANTITISEGGNAGYVNFIKEKFWSSGHCYTLHDLKIDKYFLYQCLKNSEKRLMKLQLGTALKNIRQSEIVEFELNIPKSIKEQEKIGGYLSLLDAEIDNLKKQKELIKEMKRGAMQKLLSGEVRLLE
ncbi:restriction endonuclease subunit S [Brachyspira aalborgi]|uniref:restriction endonuclease subunit S n=1 Tax=Brachyspira aalborgi TaxID=29522 RepID=UPI0011C741A5|nr:restriction endonuclease subunit S [Brachyspira aalborgi]TXJ15026.1 restriction endonuclease subunit S [Brachyspira aalborgi]TXJ18338.1 restriction endonuclease subunit S [Brachyspira aalborgi]